MRKKLVATLTIAIFLLSTLAIIVPTQATFTLGNSVPYTPYAINNFDPHVPGVIGYVWPGSGECAYLGYPNTAPYAQCAPGYQAPYPNGNPPGGNPSWYQLEGNNYEPFGAVLTNSTGDLIFGLNATACAVQGAHPISLTTCAGTSTNYLAAGPSPSLRYRGEWDQMAIYLPPGFTVPGGASQVVTSFTNDYSGIAVFKASPYDRYGPNDTVIWIVTDAGVDANQAASSATPTGVGQVGAACIPGTAASPEYCGAYYQHQYLSFTNLGEWYYVRINGVTAPSTAGKYFFKIFLGSSPSSTLGGEEGTNQAAASAVLSQNEFIPTENWPVMLVKGEVDPAIATGTIRYAGYNATLYGQPVQEAGKVTAVMTTRLDPYTGQQRPDLANINAVGYFNATAQGHYEVEGLAPGIYDLYAEAAGFPLTLCTSGFTVLRGQSLHFDCYLQPGAVIHGSVFSKHQFGDELWPGSMDCCTGNPYMESVPVGSYMKIELYANPTLSNIPDPSAGPAVSWSPLPCIAGGQYGFYPYKDAGQCGDPRAGAAIAFPWHEYTPANGYGYPTAASSGAGKWLYYQVSAPSESGLLNGAGTMTQDPQGVGPPQTWYVNGFTTNPFTFEFGAKGEYGAPRDLDGGVPQVYATWVNGLTPGRYYVRAWTFRYVQTALDGATFQEYYFDVTPNEWAGDVTLPMDLRLSSWVNKTVHFHDTAGTITDQPIDTGAGAMAGVLMDANGVVWSYNQSALGYYGYYSSGKGSGFNWNPNSYPGSYATGAPYASGNSLDAAQLNAHAIETGQANIQFWGWNDTWGGENYGIPSGTYTPHVFALGYIETSPVESVSVTLSGNPTSISDHMYRAAGFNMTVYSIDWERPTVARNWLYGQWGTGPYVCTGVTPTCATAGTQQSGQMPFTWGEGYTYKGAAVGGQGGTGTPCHFTFPGGATATYCGPFSTNANLPAGWAAMVGQEIDVGIYHNGSLVNFVSDQAWNAPDTTPSSCLFQNDTTSYVSTCGGGWNPAGVNVLGTPYSTASNLGFDANGAFFGQELGNLGRIGGSTGGSGYTLTATALFGPSGAGGLAPVPGTVNALYQPVSAGQFPSAIPANQQYDFRAYTYGYVQDQDFSAWASSGQVADVRLNLVQGVNVTLDVLFKKESIISPTDMNMSARVRLFNDQGQLVAEWMSSEGTYVPANGFARAADGTTQYPFNNVGAPFQDDPVSIGSSGTSFNTPNGVVPYPKALDGYNYLPGGVTSLHVQMAGLPQVPAAGQGGDPKGGYYNKESYFQDPVLGSTFGVAGYAAPGTGWNGAGYFPNTGILGGSDYQGGWTAEVDFVPWYANNTGTMEMASGGYQLGSEQVPTATSSGTAPFAQYYPPLAQLLGGESFHIVPGTTATSGISLTEDLATGVGAGAGWPAVGWSVGHSMAANMLGPYSQQGVWQISNAHNSGEASAVFEVDLNGFVSGVVVGFTYAGDFRTISWGQVVVTGASGATFASGSTLDGMIGAYLPPGNYKFTVSVPGYAPQTVAYSVTSGQFGGPVNIYLEQSQIPVPEFSTVAVVAFSALAASLYLLKRRRK